MFRTVERRASRSSTDLRLGSSRAASPYPESSSCFQWSAPTSHRRRTSAETMPRNPGRKLEEIPFTPRAGRNSDSTQKPVRQTDQAQRPNRHDKEEDQTRKPLAPGWNRVERRPRRPFNRPGAAEPDYQSDERPRHPAEQARPPGKPSKQFISKFFSSKQTKSAGGKAFGGKSGGATKHRPASRSPRGARRPSR